MNIGSTCIDASMVVVPVSDVNKRASGTIGGMVYNFQRFPTDPVGSITATFDGIKAGGEIRVFRNDGVELVGVESCSDDHVLVWPVYSLGNPFNLVTIRIVDVRYKIKEFTYRAKVGDQSIPMQQEEDPWYSNPL